MEKRPVTRVKPPRALREPRHGFDVTVETVVGRVDFSDRGDHTPIETAFLIVARHGEPGIYRFPGPDAPVTVQVTFGEERMRDA